MPRPRIIESQCYILDIDGDGMIPFQMMPEITDSKSVNWNQIEVIGRSHPILGFASSGPRTMTLTLVFFANPSNDDPTDTEQLVANLRVARSLAYPDYSKGGVLPPHRVLVRLGAYTRMIAVVANVDVNTHTLWKSGLPIHAEVTFTLIEAETHPISYDVIRAGGEGFNANKSSSSPQNTTSKMYDKPIGPTMPVSNQYGQAIGPIKPTVITAPTGLFPPINTRNNPSGGGGAGW